MDPAIVALPREVVPADACLVKETQNNPLTEAGEERFISSMTANPPIENSRNLPASAPRGEHASDPALPTTPIRYDIIGDIHGHADALRALLAKLGYEENGGFYGHPERKVIFVGDFVDRGPKIRETLRIVRAMTDHGAALAVAGNHEFNAIRFHTLGPKGKPLRPHTENNVRQHRATLDEIAEPFPDEWREWIAWFKTLPLALDLGGLRIVHASWCPRSLAVIGGRRFDDAELLYRSSNPDYPEYQAVSALLNGPEIELPVGVFFRDKEGHERTEIRVRWFRDGTEAGPITYRSLVLPASDHVPEVPVDVEVLAKLLSYDESEPPVIFGHYWLDPAAPRPLARNAASVDYSVAAKTGGLLTAYRWDGERVLSYEKFVTVPTRPDRPS